jgi:hypothetical protein
MADVQGHSLPHESHRRQADRGRQAQSECSRVHTVIARAHLQQAGLNEITISDLTSLADPDSIRVAGTTDDNPARINDLTVDQVNNPYSSLSTLSDSEEESDDDDDEEPQTLQDARQALRKVIASTDEMKEERNMCSKELSLLDQVNPVLPVHPLLSTLTRFFDSTRTQSPPLRRKRHLPVL